MESSHEEFDEVERYELREPKPYAFHADRREFVQTLGAGIMVAVAASRAEAQRRSARRDEPLSERFHFGEDGVITVMTSKVEVGQGSRTQISQAAAEEFGVTVDQIRLIMADTDLCPDDGGTAGSRTTPSTVPRVRNAAAAARQLLLMAAAEQLGSDELELSKGHLRGRNGASISLAELVKNQSFQERLKSAPPSSAIKVTAVSEWKVLGSNVPKVDAEAIVTGKHQYPSDVIRPGMVYGKVLRPNAYGATLKSIDLKLAEQLDGVTAVRDGEFVGCVAATSWQAAKALDKLLINAEWHPPEGTQTSSDKLIEHLKATSRESSGGRNRPKSWGDLEAAMADASKRLEADYKIAYVQHAPMEPRAAVAEWDEGKLTVWTGTQQPSRVHGQLCETFRLPRERVRVIVPDTGGGFGGKHTGEAAIEAARLSKAVGKPVHLRWTREEEFTWAYFRPAGLIEIAASLDASGKLVGWDFANYNSGGSAIDTPYEVPNGRTRFLGADAPLRQGSYRALASTANVFARECAMDELAELSSVDPLEFRLKHLKPGRLRDVLVAAAKKFGWQQKSRQAKRPRGIGIACGTEKGSYTAACAEVEVVDDEIRVLSACQSFECGAIHNPDNLRRQVEGCLVMGLGAALYEQVQFADGRIPNPMFSGYQVPRMRDLPQLDIVLLNRPDLASVGGSETPIIAIAPAIANAVYNAVGTRCRSMPLKLSPS